MKQYFKIGPARCKTLGIPEGTIFPVNRVETNMTGGKGFDSYVFLDTGDGYHNGVYIGQQEMFAARGEFVSQEDYDLQQAYSESQKLEAQYQVASERDEQDLVARRRAALAEYLDYMDTHAHSKPYFTNEQHIQHANALPISIVVASLKVAIEDAEDDEAIEAILLKHGIIGEGE